jgi:hypothetical protein
LTVFDIPKAAHFRALLHGQPVSSHDPIGLKLRWHAAEEVRKRVTSMILLSPEASNRIKAVLEEVNAKLSGRGWRVELDRKDGE